MKLLRKILIGAGTGILVFGLAGCQNNAASPNNNSQGSSVSQILSSRNVSANQLSHLNYRSGTKAYISVNHNHSTLSPRTWRYDHISYARLDRENRTSSPDTAYLDRNNIAHDNLRVQQTVQPTGWHQKWINNQPILNRGHEIAYSLSGGINQSGKYKPRQKAGDQDNPKNLFTQTALSNQKLQTIYESKVRRALYQGKKVVYQVQPIFSGRNQMAKGVHLQAISTDRTLNFNVYIFNVQPGIAFNYNNGRSRVDRSMRVPVPVTQQLSNTGRRIGLTRGRRSHHLLKDYMIYRIGKHMGKRQYMKRYYPRYHRGLHLTH